MIRFHHLDHAFETLLDWAAQQLAGVQKARAMLMMLPVLLLATGTPQWDYTGMTPVETTPQVFYILHSGLSDTPNYAAHGVESALIASGVTADHIIVMPDPYIDFYPGSDPHQTGSVQWVSQLSVNVLQNISSYLDSATPTSNIVQSQYKILQQELKSHSYNARRGDRLVWIGHSAGGQMGLTMAFLLHQQGINLSKIILLGSPIYRNNAPHEARIIAIVSTDDWVLRSTSRINKLFPIPPNLDKNDKVIQLPGLGHSDYYINPDILKRIVTEALSKDILQTHV